MTKYSNNLILSVLLPLWVLNLSACGSSDRGSGSSSSSSGEVQDYMPLPGRWQAQNYHSASTENDERSGASSGPCALGDVDMDETEDEGGLCFVGWTQAGEWLQFETLSNSSAVYNITLRASASEPSKQVSLTVDGVDVGTASIPANGFELYSNVSIPAVAFTTGEHSVRVIFDDGGVNLNYLEFSESSSSSSSSSSSGGLEGYHPDIVRIVDIDPSEILREPGADSWKDSYSVGDRCYCDSTFDHNIGGIVVDTPQGNMTVLDVCQLLGPGPGSEGRPIYNDIQCGNGPANDAGDEDYCPGRVDLGKEGCVQIGPRWNFN